MVFIAARCSRKASQHRQVHTQSQASKTDKLPPNDPPQRLGARRGGALFGHGYILNNVYDDGNAKPERRKECVRRAFPRKDRRAF